MLLTQNFLILIPKSCEIPFLIKTPVTQCLVLCSSGISFSRDPRIEVTYKIDQSEDCIQLLTN